MALVLYVEVRYHESNCDFLVSSRIQTMNVHEKFYEW
jgi:hypothetical protein